MLKPMRPCLVCKVATREPYCADHKKEVRKRVEARRLSANDRGYDYRWSQIRDRHIQDYPLCGQRGPLAERTAGWRGECFEQGRLTAAECVDHIVPFKGDTRLRDDPANHQSMCLRCNSLKAVKFEGGFGHQKQG